MLASSVSRTAVSRTAVCGRSCGVPARLVLPVHLGTAALLVSSRFVSVVPRAAAATPGPAPPTPSVSVLPPAAAYNNAVTAGAAKAAMPAWKILLMGIQAGVYISFGGFLAVTVGGSLAGQVPAGLIKLIVGLVFPFGLMITLLCGAELYTGNTAFVTAAHLEGKTSFPNLLKNWSMSYLGNFIGSLAMVSAVVATGLLVGNPMPAAMATAKCSLTFTQAVIRGVLCNWLVCCAVWMSASATSLPGKVLGCWIPVTAFVTMGLEHSIANMFFISLGISMGAEVTFTEFLLKNLLPVTLGNTLAGVLGMAVAYGFVYGSLGKPKAVVDA